MNYNSQLKKQDGGRDSFSIPPSTCVDITGPRHLSKAQRVSSPLQRNGLSPPTPSEPTPEEMLE